MSQPWATAFYKSHAWLANRKRYLQAPVDTSGDILVSSERGNKFVYEKKKDGTVVPDSMVIPPGMCERCFELGKLVPADTVHHIIHLTPENINDPHITLNFDNLMRVCRDCHAELHSGTQRPRVTFDENGNIVPPADKEAEFREQIRRLTETVGERRNIHKEDRYG